MVILMSANSDSKKKRTVASKNISSNSPDPPLITKSQFMSDLKKVSRRLTDAPSDHRPDKPEPTK